MQSCLRFTVCVMSNPHTCLFLIRMQREQLISANEHLLCVVIALSRHSPAAAKAVMKCPRLMDSIIQRFLLIDEDLDAGLRSTHSKAIQLLKVCLLSNFTVYLEPQLALMSLVPCMLLDSTLLTSTYVE